MGCEFEVGDEVKSFDVIGIVKEILESRYHTTLIVITKDNKKYEVDEVDAVLVSKHQRCVVS